MTELCVWQGTIEMSHVTHERIMSHTWMSHVTYIIESCHSYTRDETWHRCQQVMSLESRATLCNTLQHTATLCNTLQHTATHCNTLQHTATHCNTLQHTATHCNKLPHTATHWHTLDQERSNNHRARFNQRWRHTRLQGHMNKRAVCIARYLK